MACFLSLGIRSIALSLSGAGPGGAVPGRKGPSPHSCSCMQGIALPPRLATQQEWSLRSVSISEIVYAFIGLIYDIFHPLHEKVALVSKLASIIVTRKRKGL